MESGLFIQVTETVKRNIYLQIGVDITKEKADEIRTIGQYVDENGELHTNSDFPADSPEYATLQALLGDDVEESERYTNVHVEIGFDLD